MEEKLKALRGQILGLLVILVLTASTYFERQDLKADVERLEVVSLTSLLLRASFPSVRIVWEEDEAVEGRQDQPSPYRSGRLVLEAVENAYRTKGEADVTGVGRMSFEHIPADSRETLVEWTRPSWTENCPPQLPQLFQYQVAWRDGLRRYHTVVVARGNFRITNFGECFEVEEGWSAFLGREFRLSTLQPATSADLEAEAATISARVGIAFDSSAKAYIALRSRLNAQRISIPALGLSLPIPIAAIALMLSAAVASIGVLSELRVLASLPNGPRQILLPLDLSCESRLSHVIEGGVRSATIVIGVALGPASCAFAFFLLAPTSLLTPVSAAAIAAAIIQMATTIASLLLVPRALRQAVDA